MPHRDYIVDGIKWPSVTEVLSSEPKPWLERWYAKYGRNRCEQKARAAAAFGTKVHGYIDEFISGKPVLLDLNTRRLNAVVPKFTQWCSENVSEVVCSERHVESKRYMYHGTFDAIIKLKSSPRTLTLVDWKTSNGISDTMGVQLAAYANAIEESMGLKVKNGLIVLVSKKRPHKLVVEHYTLGTRLFSRFTKMLREMRERE